MKNYYNTGMKIFSAKGIYLILFCLLLNATSNAQQPGNTLKFDGNNDYVALPNTLTSAITQGTTTAITIEYWFKGTNLQSAVRLQNRRSSCFRSLRYRALMQSADGIE